MAGAPFKAVGAVVVLPAPGTGPAATACPAPHRHAALITQILDLLAGNRPRRRPPGLRACTLLPRCGQARQNKADLAALRELLEAGKITPVIDRTYPLAEVAAAIRYLEQGHARGKVATTV